jgi:hypothetical protein
VDTAGVCAPRIRADRLQRVGDRQPAGRSNHQRARHRHPNAEWPVDRPGNHRQHRCTHPGPGGPDFTHAAQRHRSAGHIYLSTIVRVPGLHRVLSGRGCGRGLLGCGSRDPAITAAIE